MVMDGASRDEGADGRSAHMTDHMSARNHRIEVITRGDRRRRWSVEEKREIALESAQEAAQDVRQAVVESRGGKRQLLQAPIAALMGTGFTERGRSAGGDFSLLPLRQPPALIAALCLGCFLSAPLGSLQRGARSGCGTHDRRLLAKS